jgi:hypothetical protein
MFSYCLKINKKEIIEIYRIYFHAFFILKLYKFILKLSEKYIYFMFVFLFLEPKTFISFCIYILYYKILIKRDLEVFLYIVKSIYLFL